MSTDVPLSFLRSPMFGSNKAVFCGMLKVIILGIWTIVLGNDVLGCKKNAPEDRGGEKRMPTKTIERVLKEHTDEWMAIPGVVGTAMGEHKGKPCIKILVVEKTQKLARQIPSQVEGFPVVIEETGEIRALRAH